jgi:hypothetical protein
MIDGGGGPVRAIMRYQGSAKGFIGTVCKAFGNERNPSRPRSMRARGDIRGQRRH